MKILLYTVLCLASTSFLTSCSGNGEGKAMHHDIDSVMVEPEYVPATRSWPTDLPSHKFEITSVGMGDFLLYDYPDSTVFVGMNIKPITIQRSGLKWDGLVVNKGNGQWLRAESFQSTGHLTRIFTNSPSYATRSGIYAGAKASVLVGKPTEIIKYNGSQWLSVLDEGIIVRLDKNIAQPDSTSKIIEIGVICGDC
ncbi:hypothetical protein RCC89_02640 [Cytophagaceae bacterium ABcell3]|nr:hypothetical protein RCC89_02640 [Cytophagaceae bacterium ABcell3]